MNAPQPATLLASLSVASLAFAQAAPESTERPNIILILADDMSYDSVSAFNDELGGLKTPRIDRLIDEGWKLEDILPGLRDRACAWITEAAKKKEPFFLYLPLTSPHTPISPSKEFAGKSGLTPYVDFVIETDNMVGRVLDALEKTGEADNTLVIFTADNGTAGAANFKELAKHGINIRNHYRAQKASIYEGGHRVPFVVRWPKVIQPGSRNDEAVCLNDWFAILKASVENGRSTPGTPQPNHAGETTWLGLPW